MKKITEIIPDELLNIPWVKEAMDEGQLFNTMVGKAERLVELEEAVEAYISEYDNARIVLHITRLKKVFYDDI